MISKRWLLSGILLLLANGFRAAPPQTIMAQGLHQPSPANSSGGSIGPSFAEYPSRLSNLILSVPPLVLPELLLPPYDFPSFNSDRLDQELSLYLQYLRTHGKPDILIVGSSRSLQGIDPAALEEGLAKQGHSELKVYNFGINGATAQVINVLMQQILAPEQLPRLVIWGDGSRAFNSGRVDRTHSQILASSGYQRVAAGERPIPSRTTDWEIPTFVSTANKSLANSAAAAIAEMPIASDLTPQGFEVITEQYNPNTYYQRYPWVPGSYDQDYNNFNLLGEQKNATLQLAEFAKKQGITLVFVNLPLTRDYLDPTRRRYEAQFQQHMWQVAGNQGFMFRDLSQVDHLIQHQYFADPSHINHQGARAVALHLAADQTIPWHILGK